MNTFDEHDSGQLRIGAQGDLLSLLPLPDAQIPPSDGPDLASAALDDMRDGCYCPGDCNCKYQGAPYYRQNICGCKAHAHDMTRAEADAEARARLTQTREA